MFSHSSDGSVDRKVAYHWFMLSFLAGSINAGGFLSCQRFVSHITGFATLAGIDFASAQWAPALSMLTVPFFFLGGVMMAAWLTVRQKSVGKSPNYAMVMALEAFFLLVAAVGGMFGMFGNFGESFRVGSDYTLVALLCLASGLQNAAITSSSGATVRTTHLTGLATDLGIGLIELFFRARDRGTIDDLFRKNRLRIGTIFSFFLGSLLGAILFLNLGYAGFLLPAMMAVYATRVALNEKRLRNETMLESKQDK